jgi:predicted transcriptional regulator
MKKGKEKHIRLSEAECEDLRRKAEAACMTESAFIRQLIAGYVPVRAPDEKFYKVMDLIREMADKIDAVAMKTDNSVDMIAVMSEAKKWRLIQNVIEMEFLRPKRREE